MPESLVQVTSGAGPKLHTWQRTVGANNVEDEFTVPGEYPLASYISCAPGTAASTAAAHCLQVMAGASLNVRVRRIRVEQDGAITAAASQQFQIWRLSTAGTGGTVVTPAKLDSADAVSGATTMSLPTVKGTEATLIDQQTIFAVQTAPASGGITPAALWEWEGMDGRKSLIIPAGAANGIAIKCLSTRAGLSVSVTVEFVETSFV